jgi:hypothetical protein
VVMVDLDGGGCAWQEDLALFPPALISRLRADIREYVPKPAQRADPQGTVGTHVHAVGPSSAGALMGYGARLRTHTHTHTHVLCFGGAVRRLVNTSNAAISEAFVTLLVAIFGKYSAYFDANHRFQWETFRDAQPASLRPVRASVHTRRSVDDAR